MRIVWVARCPTPYRYPVLHELARDNHVRVLFFQERGMGRDWDLVESPDLDQRVLRTFGIPYREDAIWVLRAGWKKELADAEVVVLQGLWESPGAWQISRWARRRGVPVIYFSESTVMSMRWRRGPIAAARRIFLRRASAVVTPGEAATRAVESCGVRPAKITTSVNVVDVTRFREGAWARRHHSPVTANPHRFLSIARLLPRKNIAGLLRAFAECGARDATLDIVGDGPEADRLRGLAVELAVEDRVTFHGNQPEEGVIDQLARAHTLVLPSYEEVWGLVVNEALAAGLHVVVSEGCGVASTVKGHRGVYLATTDDHDLARAMGRSSHDWNGWIEEPEILSHNGSRLAQDIGSAAAACLNQY